MMNDSHLDESQVYDSWQDRVSAYLGELEQIAVTVDSVLQQASVETRAVQTPEVEKSMGLLLGALSELEEKIVAREELLRAPDAPAAGLTLTEKLRGVRGDRAAELVRRCEAVSNLIGDANHHAISLFVCQYHLADVSGEIIRLLAGSAAPPTYTAQNGAAESIRGGLFNKSA